MNKQLALAIQLNDEATLNDFNWTDNNLLEQQLAVILQQKTEWLLYLWGVTGSGKSHLLQACCHAVYPKEAAIYLPLALLKEWGPQAIEGIENHSLICIDDIDAIAGDAAWEEALFHVYNRIKDSGRSTLILSASQAPSLSPIQLPDLRSRLTWGLVMQIHELSDEDKLKSLQDKASKRGIDLPESVGQFILARCSRNMHDLQRLLNSLDQASLAAHRKITIPFVKNVLRI